MSQVTKILVAILGSTVLASLVTNIFQLRHDRQNFSREIAKNIIENVFSKYHFPAYKDLNSVKDEVAELKKFIKHIDDEMLSGYLIELREDAERLIKIKDNTNTDTEFKRDYGKFRQRIYKATISYQKKIGIKPTPVQDDSLPMAFLSIFGLFLSSVGIAFLSYTNNTETIVLGISFIFFGLLIILLLVWMAFFSVFIDTKIWWRHEKDKEGLLYKIVKRHK